MKVIASRKDKSVRIRFAGPLLSKLDAAAIKQGRSRNTEINVRLMESLGMKRKTK